MKLFKKLIIKPNPYAWIDTLTPLEVKGYISDLSATNMYIIKEWIHACRTERKYLENELAYNLKAIDLLMIKERNESDD